MRANHGSGQAFNNSRTGWRTGRCPQSAYFYNPGGDLWIHRPPTLKPNLRSQPERPRRPERRDTRLPAGVAVRETLLPACILTRTLQLVAVKYAGLFKGKPHETERGRSLVVRTAVTLQSLDRCCLRSLHDGVRGSIPLRSQQPKTACDRYACKSDGRDGLGRELQRRANPIR